MMTYEEYITEGFNSDITSKEFNYILRLLKRRVNYFTFNRFNEKNKTHQYYFNEILLSVLSDLYNSGYLGNKDEDGNKGKILKAESVGQLRYEYAVKTENSLSEDKKQDLMDKKINRIIKEYLGHTGLMYRGRYAN